MKVTSSGGGGGGGGGAPSFGLNGYVPLNRVWFSGPQLRLKQGIEQPAFLGRKPLESVKVWDE